MALPKLADYTGITTTRTTTTTHGNDNPDSNDNSIHEDIHNQWLQRGLPAQYNNGHIGKNNNNNPYYERWPLFRNARFFLSVGDGACANLGTKCTLARNIAVTVGTSAAARICLLLPIQTKDSSSSSSSLCESITVPPGLFCYRIDAQHVLVGGALTDGGSVLEWLSHLLKLNDQEMNECLENARDLLSKRYEESPCLETIMIPFLSGERSTGFRSGATGVIMGLTRATTPSHLVESALVGITLRLTAVLRLLISVIEQLQSTFDASDDTTSIRILASGKALEENALWRQMLADATALNVVLDCSTREGTSRGVAVLVRTVLSQSQEYKSDPIYDTIKATPQSHSRLFWDNALQKQELLLEALTPFF
jgi:gluconokinase